MKKSRVVSHSLNLFKVILLLVAISVLPCSCVKTEQVNDDPSQTTLLVYMAADNDLSSRVTGNVNGMRQSIKSAGSNVNLVLFMDVKGKTPCLVQIKGDSTDTLKVYDKATTDSTDPSVLKMVIETVLDRFESDTYGLLMWSHGMGWLPGSKLHNVADNMGYAQIRMDPYEPYAGNLYNLYSGYTKTFGIEGVQGEYRFMELKDMANAIPDNTFDFILFDACFMSSVEVAYALRNKCRYFIGSAYEIVSEGFPYASMTNDLLNGRLLKACREFNSYYELQSGWKQMGGVALVKTNKLEALAESFKKIVANSKDTIPDMNADNIQRFDCFRHHVFYDLGDVARYMCNDAQLLNEFNMALDDCVLFSKSTDYIFKGEHLQSSYMDEIKVNSYCGLSVFVPVRKYDNMGLNAEYRKTEWSMDTEY